jgi:hypothetical protein
MPYAERKVKGGFSVVNTKTGKVSAKHTTKAKADAQKRLLAYIHYSKGKGK